MTVDEMDDVAAQLDGLADAFETMTANAEALDAGSQPALSDLLPDVFMQQYTAFDSLGAFYDASPWPIDSESDFADLDERDVDEYVAEVTAFDDWSAMFGTASQQWFVAQIRD